MDEKAGRKVGRNKKDKQVRQDTRKDGSHSEGSKFKRIASGPREQGRGRKGYFSLFVDIGARQKYRINPLQRTI
jgi:hypothetical protein